MNLPDEGAVAVIDRRKREVAATWKLNGASNSALSSQKKDLYIGVPPHDGDVAEIRVYRIAP